MCEDDHIFGTNDHVIGYPRPLKLRRTTMNTPMRNRISFGTRKDLLTYLKAHPNKVFDMYTGFNCLAAAFYKHMTGKRRRCSFMYTREIGISGIDGKRRRIPVWLENLVNDILKTRSKVTSKQILDNFIPFQSSFDPGG